MLKKREKRMVSLGFFSVGCRSIGRNYYETKMSADTSEILLRDITIECGYIHKYIFTIIRAQLDCKLTSQHFMNLR